MDPLQPVIALRVTTTTTKQVATWSHALTRGQTQPNAAMLLESPMSLVSVSNLRNPDQYRLCNAQRSTYLDRPKSQDVTVTCAGSSNAFEVNGAPGHKTLGSKSSFDALGEFGARDFTRSAGGSNSRPGSAGFAIKNAVQEEVGEGSRSNTSSAPKPNASSGPPKNAAEAVKLAYLTAEQEKASGRPGSERQGSGNERQASLTGRARPTPPASAAGQKPMTAAEDKALLGAKFGITPSANGINAGTGTKVPTTPPPLMPRPPVSYIQETQEEDARVSRMVLADAVVPLDDINRGSTLNGVTEQVNGIKMPGPPPPLPPKPAE
ncbi:hypothetical protein C8J56DRAFT_896276 [Mycena floridula]|nr:hypothetical protein C8J56DRAFT_896276 [Mycena floridula]